MSESESNDSKIQKLLQEIRRQSSQDECVYRGEPKKHGKIASTLYRTYAEKIDAEYFDIQIAQKEMLEQVKAYTDFTDETDVLTELQHYGGKTNLIDFTTDYLIALFFACDGLPDEDGRVILLNRESNKERITSPKKNQNNRVISQKSIFFQSPKGYLDEEDYVVIPIPKELKRPVLDYLRKYHGIATHIIYNDILGYIKNQEKHHGAYAEFFIGLTSQEKGEYKEAIKHYDQAIRINPQLAVIYNNRGVAKGALGKHKEEIVDYDEAIRINPQDARAYYNRGNAKKALSQYDQAIADYDQSISINPQDAEAYNNRGNAKGRLGRHDEAIVDFNDAIHSKPQFAEAYNNRGNANKENKAYKKARADFQRTFELATEQSKQALAQDAQRSLDELPSAAGEN